MSEAIPKYNALRLLITLMDVVSSISYQPSPHQALPPYESPTTYMLVVEPDYLPDAEVLCFQPCLYPMKYLHPRSMYTLARGGVQRGVPPLQGPGGPSPQLGGLGASRPPAGVRGEAPEAKNCLIKVYCNFIVNLDRSL
jgi:hypothetical protein